MENYASWQTRIRGGVYSVFAAAALVAGTSFAGGASVDGTDFVVSADSGETYTHSTAIGNYARLVKRGAGEVVLTAASSGFAGSVVVEAGTLTVSHVDAVGGSSVAIEVKSGATLWLKVPGQGQNTVAFPHAVTIAGKGVGDNGALRYTNTGSTNAENLLTSLTLSADATIDVSTRWGMGNGKILDLNGHTLTRIGAGNWMVYNHIKSTGAPGEVNNVYGTLTMQGTPDIDENVTVVVTNVATSSFIGMWGVTSSDTIKGPIKLYSGRNITAQSGTSKTSNHIGPLHLAGPNNGQATLTSQYEKDNVVYARMMSVDGPITSDTGMGLAVSGKGSIWFNSDVSIPGNTYVQGTGNLYLSGENSRRDMKLALRGSTTTTHEAGRTYLRMLRVANGGTAASGEKAQLRQRGGVIGVGSGDNARIGETPGHRAYYTLEGGKLFTSNLVYVAEKPGSFGAVRQTGGYFESYRSPASEGSAIIIGRGGNALFVQTGGTNDFSHANSKGDQNFRVGIGSTNGVAEVTISGEGTEFRTSGLVLGGASTAPSTNILNLASGAKLKVNRFKKYENAHAKTFSVVNADGGILAPTFSWGLTGSASDAKRNPDHFVVWENGFIVDTTENASKNSSGADATTLTFHFDKPTGKGVESITLPADVASKNYIGIGRIVIEDETGWGASAYAEFDFATEKLTDAVVTSRGCDYSDNAKAYLESPDGKARYECGITLTSNDGKCGPLVKRGAPGLILNSADSTIDGGYVVEEGSLALAVIPNDAVPVRVASGATLNLNDKGALTASTFEGAGRVTKGNVTVTQAVKATCADLFAGNAATFNGDLTLGDNAVFEITDAENLPSYKDASTAVALTANAISGEPALLLTNGDGTPYAGSDAAQWVLKLSGDGTTLTFGCDKPLVMVIR